MKNSFTAFLAACLISCSQGPSASDARQTDGESNFRIMFWNAENLFDYKNDSSTADDEFLPKEIRGWNSSRYKLKINNMYKVFVAAGSWNPPDIIGLCEVENNGALFDLLKETPFSYYNYRFIHHDSPDRRGIDVCLLYNPVTVKVLVEGVVPVVLKEDTSFRTRDILLTRILTQTGDSLTVFVNHWPSKYGGPGLTAGLRDAVAEILSDTVRKILHGNSSEKIVVMGDFNDPPESHSLKVLCEVKNEKYNDAAPLLINLSKDYKSTIPGSYKFQGSWQLIDQILVSRSLIVGHGTGLRAGKFRVFAPDFLLEKDEKYGGMKPFRTYTGMVYHGGYSDHLPVILDLFQGP